MKKILTVTLLFFVFCFGINNILFAEDKFSWDFSECEIKDILYALSLDTGLSIVADDTVTGKTDFRFSGDDFDKAFDSFLRASRVYVTKEDKVWTVSRIQIVKDEEKLRLDSFDVKPSQIIEKLSESLQENITFEQMNMSEISVHLESPDTENLLQNLVKFIPGFVLEKTPYGFHFSKENTRKERDGVSDFLVTVLGEKNKIEIKSGVFSKVCEQLFMKNGKSFCISGNADVKACRTSFETDSFVSALKLLCDQNNFSFTEKDGIFYVFPKEDKKNSFLYGERHWVFFSLRYVAPEKFLVSFSVRFRNLETVFSESATGFWAKATDVEIEEILKFIEESDIQKNTYLIQLKNVKADEFIKRLPPSIDKNSVCEADGNSCLYFSGTEDSYKRVISELEIYDRPQKKIKYDLLIVQYVDTDDNQWISGFKVKTVQKGDRTGFSAQIGSVMSLNMNVLSAFGIDFAASLQSSLSQNKSRIFADTTLHGTAGKEINFTNTNTYRYRDNNLDPETGKPVYTGVTREIVSGLKLDIKPWVGEDGLITTQVKASVTRRGTDSSSLTGNPPPTSEKIVTTEVCGKSGEPVVLSGLIQNSETDEIIRTPFLSRLPLIGKFFRTEKNTNEKSQMVIYLVPFLESVQKEEVRNIYDKKWAENRKERLCRIMNLN